jgi:hypothetical protein
VAGRARLGGEAEVDLRVGGVVRVVMHDPDKNLDHGGGGLAGLLE